MIKFTCPKCNETFEMTFWNWLMATPIRWFDIFTMRDHRKTKCPHCGKKTSMKRELD